MGIFNLIMFNKFVAALVLAALSSVTSAQSFATVPSPTTEVNKALESSAGDTWSAPLNFAEEISD